MAASIAAKQSLDFQIIIDLLIYCLIGLHINRIYDILIIERSYEVISQNLSNKFRSFHYHMHTLDSQLIDTSN